MPEKNGIKVSIRLRPTDLYNIELLKLAIYNSTGNTPTNADIIRNLISKETSFIEKFQLNEMVSQLNQHYAINHRVKKNKQKKKPKPRNNSHLNNEFIINEPPIHIDKKIDGTEIESTIEYMRGKIYGQKK